MVGQAAAQSGLHRVGVMAATAQTDRRVATWNAGRHNPPRDPYRFLALAVLGQAYDDLRGWGQPAPQWNAANATPTHADALEALAFFTSGDCEGWAELARVPDEMVEIELRLRLKALGLEEVA